ncbi:hypothetical protein [Parapedobacter lycopersici]|uniref:hypothetical protein n=1 Tax=Parapedobacter lycopersici TaxID=1864939 RepID=UPI00214DE255|nr:hypothetical protein [Parapedobacter lycopersici]
MIREKLAALEPSKVRKDKSLFALFKKYATEDAAQVFPGGKLPSGCFGCSFSKHFATWRKHYLPQQEENRMPSKKTYDLNDPNYRVYFKGRVLDKNSSNEDWEEWVKYPSDADKRKKRAGQFKKLPSVEVEDKPKKSKAKRADILKASSEEKVIDQHNKQDDKKLEDPEQIPETNE